MTTTHQRTDIQALRAIAVSLVILNHFWNHVFSGGYIGVDIFFVISGFLITSHLLKEISKTNRVNFTNFYIRRAKRLLPAALLVSIVSIVFSILYTPLTYIKISSWDFFASSAYFQNWNLYKSATNYFAQDSIATPFRHYWSLSVEEQFYLIWPVFLLLSFFATQKISKFFGGNSKFKKILIITLILSLGLISFFLANYQVWRGNNGAYFNTFGRIWEFTTGALTAFLYPLVSTAVTTTYSLFMKLARNLLQAFCYVLLLLSLFVFTENSGVPGILTLFPVMATAVIIILGPTTYIPSLKLLVDARITQFWGDISYSLYLWHWPVFILFPFILGRKLNWWELIYLLPLLAILSFLTKKYIEDPFRIKFSIFNKPHIALASVFLSFILVFVSSINITSYAEKSILQEQELNKTEIAQNLNQSSTNNSNDKGQRPTGCLGALAIYNSHDCVGKVDIDPKISAGAEVEAPWLYGDDTCVMKEERPIASGGALHLANCDYSGGANKALKVWVLGDSHAEQWKAALADTARNQKWDITLYTHSGCPTWGVPYTKSLSNNSIFDVPQTTTATCLKWSQEAIAKISNEKPDVIILANYSSTQGISDGTNKPQAAQYISAMKEQINAWEKEGAQVIVFRDTPTAGTTIGPVCVAVSGQNCVTSSQDALLDDPQFNAAKTLGTSTLDMSDYFCPNGTCKGVIGGIPVFYDTNHMSLSYNKTLAAPLRERLLNIITKK